MLLAALGWGALHALEPGHGKAMVAAYLVGTRGTPAHAFVLGGIVTLTHTAGVFALGLVALLLAQYVAPEDLYPWLALASGLLIVAVGIGLLRSRLRWAREQGGHQHSHENGHPHPHEHGHDHDHGHEHPVSGEHHHLPDPAAPTWRGLLGMGASAGLIPCPSALVVLLAAVSQHEVGLGLVLIVAFSVGLAATLVALGLAVVYARRVGERVASERMRSSRILSALPLVSNLVILVVGIALTAKAIPGIT
jgi:nickel/cobalt transporter (NicO) family protein